jgi:hypothetical protein
MVNTQAHTLRPTTLRRTADSQVGGRCGPIAFQNDMADIVRSPLVHISESARPEAVRPLIAKLGPACRREVQPSALRGVAASTAVWTIEETDA